MRLSLIRFRSVSSIANIFKPLNTTPSLESLRYLPPEVPENIKCYIPLSSSTIFRELLWDSSVIFPSDRDNFERFATSLHVKLRGYFHLLQKELAVLSNAAISTVSLSEVGSTETEQLDRQFWLLRRVSGLAPMAGFIEVSRQDLQRVCDLKKLHRGEAMTFVNPKDYSIIRFWIRGLAPRVHPLDHRNQSSIKPKEDNKSTTEQHGDLKTPTGPATLRLKWIIQKVNVFMQHLAVLRSKWRQSHPAPFLCFDKVLMVVQTIDENQLRLRLFNNVPISNYSNSLMEDLRYLLPVVRFRPLSTLSRTVFLATSATAIGCLGVVAPISYLLSSNSDLVFAWSIAATACAGVATSLMWVHFHRALYAHSQKAKQLYYDCGVNSDIETLNSLLKIAFEEEFKSVLLTYALLLHSTNGFPISPIQLGVRAESWILNRLTTEQRMNSTSRVSTINASWGANDSSDSTRTIVFSPERSLNVLRRLNLIHGPPDKPQAIPLNNALDILQDNSQMHSTALHPIWLLEPLMDEPELDQPSRQC